jgi:hypothetical protein
MKSNVISPALFQSAATAEALRSLCATTPSMSWYQPVAASAVEVCTVAISVIFFTDDYGLVADKFQAREE